MTSKTLQICTEIGKDASRSLARAGISTAEGLAQIVCKFSYPILGNLSSNLQTRIETLVGDRYYCASDATMSSVVINGLIGAGYVGSLLTEEQVEESPFFYTYILAVCAGFIMYTDLSFREITKPRGDKYPVIGSLPGKIVSLPFDCLTYVYDAGKNYLQDVKKRVERKGMRQR